MVFTLNSQPLCTQPPYPFLVLVCIITPCTLSAGAQWAIEASAHSFGLGQCPSRIPLVSPSPSCAHPSFRTIGHIIWQTFPSPSKFILYYSVVGPHPSAGAATNAHNVGGPPVTTGHQWCHLRITTVSGMFPVVSFPCTCYRTEDYHCVSVSHLFSSPLS